jgi:hypothetical protein
VPLPGPMRCAGPRWGTPAARDAPGPNACTPREHPMRKTSERLLKAMHQGHILRVIVDRCQEDPDEYLVMDWNVLDLRGTILIESNDVVPEYRRPYSVSAVEALQMDELVEWIPNTGTNALLTLTPKGLELVQELHGPTSAKVPVKHDDGIEIVQPTPDGTPAVPTGEITVYDSMDGGPRLSP